MECLPTQTPAADDIDIPALRAKYAYERDKRLVPEGHSQFVLPEGKFADAYEADPHMPVVPRDPIAEDLDVAILGAGWSGILAGYHLERAGVETFRHIDWAGDFGGVWYWNRYPGLQCDNDAYCYVPLLEETGFMPKKQYEDGWEIYEHCQRIARQFGLYKNALFHTLITSLRWDETIQRWRVATNRGDDIRARHVIMCGGPLNRPKLPGTPGIADFKGKMFHTARWDWDYTGGTRREPELHNLADKTVAIVGTGATAVQVVPYLGRYARQLFVLQRTPSCIDQRHNPPTDPEWVKTLKPGWQKQRQTNMQRGGVEGYKPGDPDLICDFWTEINRNLEAKFKASGYPGSPEEYLQLREVEDYLVMERLRRRIDAVVKDPETAEALKPYYRFLCKRPCSSNDYLETFNRPNVKLIDVSETRGVERMTERGFIHRGTEYPIDCMIFASGFEVSYELRRRWGIDVIQGKGGLSLYDHWADGFKTLHGMMTNGFPNLYFTGYTQGGFYGTTTEQFSRQGFHIAYIVKEALERGLKAVEPSLEAQDAYIRHVRETAIDTTAFQRECTPGYFNNEGEEVADSSGQRKPRSFFGDMYGPGWDAFQKLLQDWRDKGDLKGLVVTT
jgi:cyclohexanone monooxygenase